jgi:hypothetical protein
MAKLRGVAEAMTSIKTYWESFNDEVLYAFGDNAKKQMRIAFYAGAIATLRPLKDAGPKTNARIISALLEESETEMREIIKRGREEELKR